jgi:hypothetical protein
VLHDVLEAETDPAGRYELIVGSIHSEELCIDVHPVGDPLHRVSGSVRPGKPSEVAETPQLRLDLVVGE